MNIFPYDLSFIFPSYMEEEVLIITRIIKSHKKDPQLLRGAVNTMAVGYDKVGIH